MKDNFVECHISANIEIDEDAYRVQEYRDKMHKALALTYMNKIRLLMNTRRSGNKVYSEICLMVDKNKRDEVMGIKL